MKMWIVLSVLVGIVISVKGVSLDLSVCGVSKGCVTYPGGCDAASCVAAATWQNNNDGTINFELAVTGSTGSTNGWVAVGVSGDKYMDSTSCMDCVRNSADNSVKLGYSYNSAYDNNDLTTTQGLSVKALSHNNGELKCSFARQKSVTGTGEDDKIFNLANQTYYVMIGYGSTSQSTKMQHVKVPLASSSKISLEVSGSVRAELTVNNKYKAHGCLMIVAWVLFASIGIMIARYYKKAWGDTKVCGLDVWFPLHRTCMVTAFCLTAIAFIIIFVEKKGMSQFQNWQPVSARAHPILGIIVMALTTINPIMALARPHPGSERREIFNWFHWGVGTLAFILSIVTVFLGLRVPSAESFSPSWLVWLMVGFVVFHILVDIILESNKYASKSKGSMSMEMRHVGEPGNEDPQSTYVFHKMVLAVYTIGATGVSIALVVTIALQ